MYVSTKEEDNKMVMGYKSDGNYKRNITRPPERGSELDLRTGNNKTEQAKETSGFPTRRVRTNEEHNKGVVRRWTELGTQPGVTGEIPERYRNSGNTGVDLVLQP